MGRGRSNNNSQYLPANFKVSYRCYPITKLEGRRLQDEDVGGKIILPAYALNILTTQNIAYPMMFKLTNNKTKVFTYSGVLEFSASDRSVHLPGWMMKNLRLDDGKNLIVESVTLPTGTFAKFKALSTDFFQISNPKAVLENSLRKYTCLTSGDVIPIIYNEKIYELRILETAPEKAISIIECDLNVDFEVPVGYEKEPPKVEDTIQPSESVAADYYKVNSNVKGIPNMDWKFGTLAFFRNYVTPKDEDDKNEKKKIVGFKAFSGKGNLLK